MKCFTIKSGNEYVADVPKVITSSYYYGKEIQTVDSDDEAKHYRNASAPKSWIKKNLKESQSYLVIAKQKLKKAKADAKQNKNHPYYSRGYYTNRAKENLAKAEAMVKWFEDAEVVKLDKETPNFPSDLKLRFHRWRGDNHASQMRLCKETHSRYSCKACGVILKNIPYYDLPDGNSTKICVACLYLRQDAIKTAFEGLPEDFRTQFINELILGSM